jgi:uncharacterized protein YndB with AHSA1/START domain
MTFVKQSLDGLRHRRERWHGNILPTFGRMVGFIVNYSPPVCVCEARPGGKIRYEWVDGKGGGFYLTGEFVELVPFSRVVHVERMHLPNPCPDNHVETRFEPDGSGTLMTM